MGNPTSSMILEYMRPKIRRNSISQKTIFPNPMDLSDSGRHSEIVSIVPQYVSQNLLGSGISMILSGHMVSISTTR